MGTSLQLVDRLVPGANLESYIQAASRIPVLSVDEERELAERLHYHAMLRPRVSWYCRTCAL